MCAWVPAAALSCLGKCVAKLRQVVSVADWNRLVMMMRKRQRDASASGEFVIDGGIVLRAKSTISGPARSGALK
jgi:hypothetical protein